MSEVPERGAWFLFDLARIFAAIALMVGVLTGWSQLALVPLVAFVVLGFVTSIARRTHPSWGVERDKRQARRLRRRECGCDHDHGVSSTRCDFCYWCQQDPAYSSGSTNGGGQA